MATTIRCLVARVGQTVPVPPLFASASAASQISDYFRDGSSSNIRLRVSLDKLGEPFEPASPDTAIRPYDLHLATWALLGRSSTVPGRVDRIAVLLARQYTFQKALGVMFDRGFVDPLDNDTTPRDEPGLAGSPREACALFLDTIAAYWPEPAERDEGVLFTAMHEIAHIFNLQHRSKSKDFLADPTPKRLRGHWQFHADDKVDLSTDPLDDHIHPGASIFAKGSPMSLPCFAANPAFAASPFGLALSIAPSRHEFFYFEPVELYIRLGFLPGVHGSIRVPDEIDPGYARFRIWIEEPTGERRLYRSPRRYCSAGRYRTINSERPPFERDVSIFGEAGGYTFRMAGVHRLWAELDLGAKGMLLSAPQEVRLMTRAELVRPTAELGRLLTSRAGKIIAYHRYIPRGRPELRAYEEAVDEGPGSAAQSELRYALGIGYAHLAGVADEEAAEAVRKARRWLELAAQDDRLDPHRRGRAAKRLARLAPAPQRGRKIGP